MAIRGDREQNSTCLRSDLLRHIHVVDGEEKLLRVVTKSVRAKRNDVIYLVGELLIVVVVSSLGIV